MTIPTLSTPPTAPSRSMQPAAFIAAADAWIAWWEDYNAELNAWADAVEAQAAFENYTGTSTTSVAVGTGDKTFTTQTGLLFAIGQFVIVANTANVANYMLGQVKSYDSGTGALVVTVASVGGSGTLAAWTIALQSAGGSYLGIGGGTLTGGLTTATPASGQESLIIPHGAAPSAPTNGSIWTTSAGGLFYRINSVTYNALPTAGGTLTGVLVGTTPAAGGSGYASIRLPHGAAPTTNLTNGDMWTTSAGGLFYRINGVTYNGATLAGTETLTNKTLTDIAATSTIKDSGGTGYAIGYKSLPQVTASGATTFDLTHQDKSVDNTTGGWVIPANASVAFPIGTLLSGYNNSSSNQTLSITSDTLRLGGTATTGSRTIAQRGSFTARKVATTEWVVSGTGVS